MAKRKLPDNDQMFFTPATYDGLRKALEAAAQTDAVLEKWRTAIKILYTELHKTLQGEMTPDELKKRLCLIVDNIVGEQSDLARQSWVKREAAKAVAAAAAAANPKTKRTR